MLIGNTEFDFERRSYVMGILNLTPDSFSDGGRYFQPEAAVDQALRLEAEGAALIDIGAESSRPGAKEVPADEEWSRLAPVLRKLAPRLKVPISVDTRRAATAEQAVREGVSLINDISGLTHDFRMGEVIAQSGVPCILMHMRGEPETMQRAVRYLNVVSEIIHFLKKQIEVAVRMGISRSQILVDPGFGFGKELPHNLEILRRLSELKALEAPIVVGISRKSMIRQLLDEADPRSPEVAHGSVTAAAVAALKGASIIRSHDVGPTVRALKVVAAIRETPLEFSKR